MCVQHMFMLCSTKTDGLSTKTCIKLNHGENVVADAMSSLHVFEKFLADEKMPSPQVNALIFGDQLLSGHCLGQIKW